MAKMAISKDRIDRFTSKDSDFEIVKPAPKKNGSKTGKAKAAPKKPAKSGK